MNKFEPQRFFVPELQREIMVERISDYHYIAHVNGNQVRVAKYEMNAHGWIDRGAWDKEKESLTIIQFCRKYGHEWSEWFKNNRTEGRWRICKRCLDVEVNHKEEEVCAGFKTVQ